MEKAFMTCPRDSLRHFNPFTKSLVQRHLHPETGPILDPVFPDDLLPMLGILHPKILAGGQHPTGSPASI